MSSPKFKCEFGKFPPKKPFIYRKNCLFAKKTFDFKSFSMGVSSIPIGIRSKLIYSLPFHSFASSAKLRPMAFQSPNKKDRSKALPFYCCIVAYAKSRRYSIVIQSCDANNPNRVLVWSVLCINFNIKENCGAAIYVHLLFTGH